MRSFSIFRVSMWLERLYWSNQTSANIFGVLTGSVQKKCEILRKIHVVHGVVEFNEVDSPHLLGPCLYDQFFIATVINIDVS